MHYLNHVGKWFQSRGPLNIPQGPQGRPVVIQAGSSGRGKAFAARWSEVIFALQPNMERMRVFTAEVRAALRHLLIRSKNRAEPLFMFINNRLEGFAPGTIAAVIEGL